MVWRSVCVEIVVLCLLTNSTKTETLSPLSLAETSHCSGLVDSQLHSTSRADCLQYLFFKVQSLWPCFFLLTVLYCSVLDRALLFYFAACHSHCISILFFFFFLSEPKANCCYCAEATRHSERFSAVSVATQNVHWEVARDTAHARGGLPGRGSRRPRCLHLTLFRLVTCSRSTQNMNWRTWRRRVPVLLLLLF